MTDDLDRARQRRQRRGAKVGAFGPSARKRQAIDRVMARVDDAAERRDPAAYYAGQVPTPERITLALDFADLDGPDVDRALGGVEPMVDEWESGVRVPSFAEIKALAMLTRFPLKFFYQPPPQPITGGLICGADGCQPLGEVPPRG